MTLTERELAQLADLHSQQRMHVCPDGYRWQVTPQPDGQLYVGCLYDAHSNEVHHVERQTHYAAEKALLAELAPTRAGGTDLR